MSAGEAPSRSANSCGVAPRVTRTTLAVGAPSDPDSGSASGSVTASAAGAAAAPPTWPFPASGVGDPASTGTIPPGACSAASARRRGSCSSVAALGLLPGRTCPPAARIRGTASSGTVEEAVRPSKPMASNDSRMSLLDTPSSRDSS